MPLEERIRQAMRNGGDLRVLIDRDVNEKGPQYLNVYLHENKPNEITINLKKEGGEEAQILWLPWRQGSLATLQEFTISRAKVDSLFFTFQLTGCKIFSIKGGPVWHIDALVDVVEFWPEILKSDWVFDNWPVGESQEVAYIHRAGQAPEEWDLSQYLEGPPPATYGAGNIGNAFLGGIVNAEHTIDIYFQSSPWNPLKSSLQKRKKT